MHGSSCCAQKQLLLFTTAAAGARRQRTAHPLPLTQPRDSPLVGPVEVLVLRHDATDELLVGVLKRLLHLQRAVRRPPDVVLWYTQTRNVIISDRRDRQLLSESWC